jgi:hypothetical protein
MSMLNMVTGAEELDLDGAGAEEGAEAVAAAVSAEVAELSTQIEEQGTQIEKLAEEVKSLDETAEEVLENVEGLEGMLASGNFSSIGFANIFNRTDKLASKLGGVSAGSRLGAESISDATTAQMMARTGIEGFMDTVKSWGKKAAEYIKHIFNTVISFVVGLFSQAAGIQRQAESLEKRLESAKVKDKIKLGSWNIYFDYKANGLEAGGSSEGGLAFGDGIDKLIGQCSGTKIDVSAFSSAYGTLVTELKSFAVAGKGSKKKETKDAGKDVVIGQHAGIRTMVSFKDGALKDEKACAEAARALRLAVGKDGEAAKKLSNGEEVKSKLGAGELKGILGKVKTTANNLRQSKVAKKFSAAERDRVVGMLSAVSASDKTKEEEIGKAIEVTKAVYASLIALFTVGERHQSSLARAGLAGVAAHLNIGGAHETEPAKKK